MKSKQDLLKDSVHNAPRRTGIYLMKDEHNNVIYVGKSKNLRTRVRSYFGGKDTRPMIPFLMSRVKDMEFIVTNTEKEALILENSLIKKHKPRYNVTFKDDKNYFNIRIDLRDKFPRLQLVRRIKRDGARYFGPYSSSAAVKETLQLLQKVFPLRTCKDVEFNARQRPCIEYEIKRCLAPCCNLIGSEEYERIVKDVILFMDGHGEKLISKLKKRMIVAANKLDFEKATTLRDRISAISATLEKQQVVSKALKDQDVFGLYRSGDLVQICLVFVRKGTMLGAKRIPLFKVETDSAEVLSSLLKQYYDGGAFIPQEIIISETIEDKKVIEEWLTEKRRGKKVSVIIPKRGDRVGLLSIAVNNAENIFTTERIRKDDEEIALNKLAERLGLKKIPHRIECFDISNVGGHYAVGSMVSFSDGKPDTSGYRRFRIKTVEGADDYSMMYEILKRHYRNATDLPDLIVIDGGKGQLNVALSVLEELKISDIDVIGLAKEHHGKESSFFHKGKTQIDKEEDRIYLPMRKNPVYLSRYPSALFVLQRVRDEAHRFAVSYHRKLKEQADFRSIIDEIPGVGDLKKRAILRHFGDVEKVKKASKEELEKVPGIGKEMADRIFNHFHTV
ncbi:MAG: excinuclease ABC subunit UvrC [Deltaproteobacteria bacterium]|nr:excinuclease ABC subunit UvrC [Deltaproteobacteria bacterium]